MRFDKTKLRLSTGDIFSYNIANNEYATMSRMFLEPLCSTGGTYLHFPRQTVDMKNER